MISNIRGNDLVHGCSYMAVRQAALEAQRAEAMAAYMDQTGMGLGQGKPFMPLLVSTVAHKACFS